MNARLRSLLLLFLLLVPVATCSTSPAAELNSSAIVNPDGSLTIKRTKIWLSGIYIPTTDRTCQTYNRPATCGPRAVLALQFKVSTFFVSCQPEDTFADGSISAVCYHQGDDLGAWMLSQGWAVALPTAPFHYQALEKIAEKQHLGIWGQPLDHY